MTNNVAERPKTFKATLNYEQSRRSRQETSINIRKNKKEDRLKMRRRMGPTSSDDDHKSTVDEVAGASKSLPEKTVQQLVEIMSATAITSSDLHKTVQALRKLLSKEDSAQAIEEVIQTDAVSLLCKFLDRDDQPKIQFETAWCLTNIASTNQTGIIARSGAVHKLIRLFVSNSPDVREQAAWCIGNIAGDSQEYRDGLLQEPCLAEGIIKNLDQPHTSSLLQNFAWMVSNLFRGKPSPALETIRPYIRPMVNNLRLCDKSNEFDSGIADVRSDTCWALVYLTNDADTDRIEALRETGVIPLLVSIVKRFPDNKSLLVPTIRCIGNMVSSVNAEPTDDVLTAGLLDHAFTLLGHKSRPIRKDICWIMSNIAAGTPNQITELFNNVPQGELINAIVEMGVEEHWEVRKEAIWTVSNLFTSATAKQIMALVEAEGLHPICKALMGVNDTKLIFVAMDAIENALEISETYNLNYPVLIDEYGGIDSLEELQQHPNDDVYEKANHIISRFFAEENDEHENIAPDQDDTTFKFGMTSKELFPEGFGPKFSFGGTTGSNTTFGGPAAINMTSI